MSSAALPRLTEQIIRNNIATNLKPYDTRSALQWGIDEYFESWGNSFPYEADGPLLLHPNSALNEEERHALQPLVDLLNEAWEASQGLSPEAFLETDWPDLIEQSAQRAHAVMVRRGRFSEVEEEQEPSLLFDD